MFIAEILVQLPSDADSGRPEVMGQVNPSLPHPSTRETRAAFQLPALVLPAAGMWGINQQMEALVDSLKNKL